MVVRKIYDSLGKLTTLSALVYTYKNATFLFIFCLKVIKVKQSDDKFEVTLDVPQYRPEELKVTVINNILSIEGAHNESKKESKDEDGSFASSVMRQFSRKWTLPPNCDPDKVQSNLSSDGILMVTAPKEISALSHESQKAIGN